MILNENQLTSIPPELGQLVNLQELDLEDNQLTSIPSELGQLSNLKYLYLTNNQLVSIPKELGQLSNLVVLYLTNNQLVSIPSELGHLSKLDELELTNNQLTSIPSELWQLTNLKIVGYKKPTSFADELRTIVKTVQPSFIDEIKTLSKKAKEDSEKEANEYPLVWMTLHKETLENHIRKDAKEGSTFSTCYFYKTSVPVEKCKTLLAHLNEVYKGFKINVDPKYVTFSWVI